ncbi:hypothetical protein, partial [Streptomyces galilaeus]|uniref:hypothetical protein n=1 Tax=Streptomyces galilaeus TaxID=33899 RepID=UPI0038F6030D
AKATAPEQVKAKRHSHFWLWGSALAASVIMAVIGGMQLTPELPPCENKFRCCTAIYCQPSHRYYVIGWL